MHGMHPSSKESYWIFSDNEDDTEELIAECIEELGGSTSLGIS